MKILLVDDSLTIRTLLRRVLGEMGHKDTFEAGNGIEALAHIGHHRFDLVVMDVNMPLMDGLETLEAIRSAPEHRSLPVVMLTSEKSEDVVRRLVALGITGYLAKPLSKDSMADALSRIITRLQQPSAAPTAPAQAGPARSVLVVEHDPDLRYFLVSALSGHYEVAEADSAASALQICHGAAAPVFDVTIVGPHVALPPVEMFVPKLRAVPQLSAMRVMACGDKGARPAPNDLFDFQLELSHVPEVFLADFGRALAGIQTPLARLLMVRPSLAEDVTRAAEQLFGMMLSCELDSVLPGARADAGPTVLASIGLQTEGEVGLSLLFRADMASARAIAGKMVGAAPDEVAEVEVLASAAELSNIVLGRLRNRLIESGIPAQVQLPKTWVSTAGIPTVSDPHALELAFASRALGARFEFVLLSEAS